MYLIIKRLIDLIVSTILIIICAIPMIIVAIAIKLSNDGPIIYKSKRIGKGMKAFNIYKFRTMITNRKELQSVLSHDEMTTKVGKILRKTSLDELPQLFNILKGEMSFIGPRPWIPDYYEWFTEEQKRRADVLPGISGLAQIKGRNGINIFKKIEYDLEYINKISFWLDVKIFFATIISVFKKTNAEISENGIKNEINQLKRMQEENIYKYKEEGINEHTFSST